MKNFWKIILLTLFLALSPISFAQDAVDQSNTGPTEDEPKIGGFFSGLESVAAQIGKHVNSAAGDAMAQQGIVYAGKVTPAALSIGGSLALVYLFAEVIKHLGGSGKGSILNVIFDVVVPAVVAAFFINNYGTFIGHLSSLLKVFTFGETSLISSITSYYGSILFMVSDTIVKSLTAAVKTNLLSTAFLAALLDVLACILFAMMIIVITFMSLAELVGLVLMGPFLYAVAVAFGPIMIAGIVTPWTRDYFGKWAGFVIGTAVLTGAVTIILNIALTLFGPGGLSFSTFDNSTSSSINMAVAMIMIVAVNSLISQAPAIASALVPGSIGVSKADAGQSMGAVGNLTKQGGVVAAKGANAIKNRISPKKT